MYTNIKYSCIFTSSNGTGSIGKFLVMVASSPSTITRSQMVVRSGKGKSFVSTTFTATFVNGSQKMLNLKEWVTSGLINESSLMETALGRDECVLYFLDWSDNPLRGDFKKNYPKR